MKKSHINVIELSDVALQETTVYKNFAERSEIAQEVISHKSGFWEKWALLLFLIILLSLASGTWFIKYPDIIEGRAVLIGQNSPKEIVPKQSGKLTALFAKNNQTVKEGEILGWLESNANTKEVIELSGKINLAIDLLKTRDLNTVSAMFKHSFSRLGELQNYYHVFVTELQKYNDYLVNGFFTRQKNMLQSDIANLATISNQTMTQKKLTQKDNELARKTFEMNETLFKDKVISADEYRQAQSKLLNNEKSLPQIDVNMLSQQNQIHDKQREIDQLNHDILQQQLLFEQALHTLKSHVDNWLLMYTLTAPTTGRVVFILPLQQNQHIEQGKLLGYINPINTKYFAEVKLAQNNFGKVDTGMKVQLRFEAYPYQETGFLAGELDYISNVAIDSGFVGIVKLDNGLITNQNKELQYKNGLKAQALVITKDMRLMERLYYNIIKSTSMNK